MRPELKKPHIRRLHLFKLLDQNAKALFVGGRVRRKMQNAERQCDLDHLKSAALQSLQPRR